MEIYERNCPICGINISYSTKYTKKTADKKNSVCKKCALSQNNSNPIKFIRNCPNCKIELGYKTELGYIKANENNSICRKCASSGENNGMYGKFGDKNPFFNKNHTRETLEKQSKIKLGKKHTKETLIKMKGLSSGENNGMYGKSIYSVWVEKYGREVADQKMNELKEKHSFNSKGDKNNMYGKQSPSGSGNGWSGWYNGWYFRSIRELTYMIKIIERFKLNWVSGESNEYKIEYLDYNGNKRNYFPDFIINNKYIVESKPKKLWGSDNVKRKKEAAIKYCVEMGLKYKIVDVGKISDEELKRLYYKKEIKFIDRYDKKFKELFGKDENK